MQPTNHCGECGHCWLSRLTAEQRAQGYHGVCQVTGEARERYDAACVLHFVRSAQSSRPAAGVGA